MADCTCDDALCGCEDCDCETQCECEDQHGAFSGVVGRCECDCVCSCTVCG